MRSAELRGSAPHDLARFSHCIQHRLCPRLSDVLEGEDVSKPVKKHTERATLIYDMLGRGSSRDVEIIARALAEAEREGRESAGPHWREWCAKRQEVTRSAWERAARAALAGDMRALRNRIELIDADPVDVVLSEAGEA